MADYAWRRYMQRKPHLTYHWGAWECRGAYDAHSSRGWGQTPHQAYASWADSIQMQRLAGGYFPASLPRI